MQEKTEEEIRQGLRLLEELVLDAGEAVTYRRLASALCVHVNQSKSLLQQFVDKHALTNNINVSMLVCGATGGGNARTILCPLKELDNIHNSLDLILFEHIYAVSRASAALESVAIANTTSFEDFTQTIGAISSALCTKLSQKEVGNLKTNSYKSLSQEKPTIQKVEIKDSKNITNNKNGMKIEHNSDETVAVQDSSKGKEKLLKEVQEPSVKQKDLKTSKGQTKNNISNFFSKTNGPPKQPIKVKEKSIEFKPKEVRPELQNIDSEIKQKPKSTGSVSNFKNEVETVKISNVENKTPVKSNNKKTKTEVVSKHSKNNLSQKNGKVDKKRKRVLKVSDSEDSDAEKDDPFEDAPAADVNMESDEDIIPPTPNADVVKITSGILNPRKRRKIVDKTYTTEDGYMVTKKEEVLESCSEDEVESKENVVEPNVKKEIVAEKKVVAKIPKSKKKLPSPQKGKQASITSFFTKK